MNQPISLDAIAYQFNVPREAVLGFILDMTNAGYAATVDVAQEVCEAILSADAAYRKASTDGTATGLARGEWDQMTDTRIDEYLTSANTTYRQLFVPRRYRGKHRS